MSFSYPYPPLPPSGGQGTEEPNNNNAAAAVATTTTTANNNIPTRNPPLPGSIYRAEVLDFRVEIEFVVNEKTGKRIFFPGIIKEVNLRRREGRVYSKHWVVFDDGEDYWYDLTKLENEGALRWPAYYYQRNPFKSEHPEAHNLEDDDNDDTKIKNPEDFDGDDTEASNSNQVYRVVRQPREKAEEPCQSSSSLQQKESSINNKRKKGSQDDDGGDDDDDDDEDENTYRKEKSSRKKKKPQKYLSSETLTIKTGIWTEEEHKLFLQGYEQYGRDWNQIASLVKTRTVDGVRAHAVSHLNKTDNRQASRRGSWTKEEHELFNIGFEQHGNDWNKIASIIKTRTVEQVRSHAEAQTKMLARLALGSDDDEEEYRGGEIASVLLDPPSAENESWPCRKNMGRWTKEEHDLFLRGHKQHGEDWKAVASMIPSRTTTQVKSHAQNVLGTRSKATGQKISNEASMIPSSTTKQVKSHAHNVFQKRPKPTGKKISYEEEGEDEESGRNIGAWTEEERTLFLRGVQNYGRDWKKIASMIKTRNGSQVEARVNHYFRKKREEEVEADVEWEVISRGEDAELSCGEDEETSLEQDGGIKNEKLDNAKRQNNSGRRNRNKRINTDGRSSRKNRGSWTEEEQEIFLRGIQMYGQNYKKIGEMINTRTRSQVKAHVTDYFRKHGTNGVEC